MRRKGKTKLEVYKEKKKELAESLEYLRQVDLPGGSQFVRDTRGAEKKEEKKSQDEIKSYLETGRQARHSYRERIANYGFTRMAESEFPLSWEYYCIATSGTSINIFGKGFRTQEGVLFIVKSPKGNVYVRGIKTTYDPEYDVTAVNIMVVQVENTMDSEKGILLSDNVDTSSTLRKTKSGILLPN